MNRKTKVRTGCSVCKLVPKPALEELSHSSLRIRRIKCDETRPFCVKCTSTGRTCEGYTPPLPRKSGTRRSKYDVQDERLDKASHILLLTTVPESRDAGPEYTLRIPRILSSAGRGAERDESRCLHYYRVRVSKDISGYFDTYFWNNLVLQLSEVEPAVRHAVLALSSLYEAGEMSQTVRYIAWSDRNDFLVRFAIYEYTKAVSMLSVRIETGGPFLEAILMSCLIFTWLEFLRGNVEVALTHLHSGLRILSEQKQLVGSRMIVKQVAHILGRVLIQATLHGSSTVDFDYHTIMGYSTSFGTLRFANLREARCDIDGKINNILRFLRVINDSRFPEAQNELHSSLDLSSLERVYQHHSDGLVQWEKAFRTLMDRLPADELTEDALPASLQLELCYLLISNTLETVFTTSSTDYDRHNRIYSRMLYLAGQILHHRLVHASESLFTLPFDNSIQGALFYVVFRCRHLPIRRDAVHLLQLCPDFEGIWNRESLISLCNWKIDIEEKGRPHGMPETEPLPESARVSLERAREVVWGGRSVMAIRFTRGTILNASDCRGNEEEVTNLSMELAGLLLTWRTMTLCLPSK